MKVIIINKNKTYWEFSSSQEAKRYVSSVDYHYSRRSGQPFKVYCDLKLKHLSCEVCPYFGNCKFQED